MSGERVCGQEWLKESAVLYALHERALGAISSIA